MMSFVVPVLLSTLVPTQFNEATNRTIELIDVLWLKGKQEILPATFTLREKPLPELCGFLSSGRHAQR